MQLDVLFILDIDISELFPKLGSVEIYQFY